MALDKRGRRLLGLLRHHGTLPASTLGKSLRVSRETIRKRIARLQEQHIITQFTTYINGAMLGYAYFKVFLTLNQATPSEEQDVIDYLLSSSGVAMLRLVEGTYHIVFVYIAEHLKEFEDLITELTRMHGAIITNRSFARIHNIQHYVHRFILPEQPDMFGYSLIDATPVTLDRIDKQLLLRLSKNCREPIAKLARDLDVSSTTLRYRMQQLEEKGVVVSYCTDIDHLRLGLLTIHLYVSMSNLDARAEVLSFFHERGVITFSYSMIGEYDLAMELCFRDDAERRELLREFRGLFPRMILKQSSEYVRETFAGGWNPFIHENNNK